MSEMFHLLSEPFPKESIRWRAQMVRGDKALALAYIDARDVMGRLDAACGPGGWQSEHFDVGGKTGCKIGVYIKNGDYGMWVWKSDGAGATAVEGDKGAFSDALKRAAVNWGIGRYLYDLGATWVPCEVHTEGPRSGKFKSFKGDPWQYVKKPPKSQKPSDSFHGPLGITALREALKALAGDLGECQDQGQLAAIIETQKSLIQQCERDLPDWYWGRGDSVGLESNIKRKQAFLKDKE